MSAYLVFCTCPDTASADALAQALVEARLAACVTRLPGARSVYRWKGAVEQADEVQLLIKTTADRYAAVRDAILARHPYELPEILAVEAATGLDRYLGWISDSTQP